MPSSSDLPHLIRLLDDQDPAVRPVVNAQLSAFGGDISDDLAALGIAIDSEGKKRLSRLLAPGRRETLKSEWLVPTRGSLALSDDWEHFENVLRQISDFLHDGITLRSSLSDNLDLLVDEIKREVIAPSADELRRWLFVKGRFRGASRADAVKYYDLCRVMDGLKGNATSLSVLFMLTGQRLGLQVDGCNYPGHFLTRIQIDGSDHLIDAFHGGRGFEIDAMIAAHPEISERARLAVTQSSHLGEILLRYVIELQRSLSQSGRAEDAQLFEELVETLAV